MTQVRKYADLPEVDYSTPDVFETPDLVEDTSTLQTSTIPRASSSESSFSDRDDPSIDYRRLSLDQARSRFFPTHVDVRDVDFSDRINRKRQSYRTSTKHHRHRSSTKDHDFGDLSSEEGESLERKLARLHREIEEVRLELDSRESVDGPTPTTGGKEEGPDFSSPVAEIDKLSSLLDEAFTRRHENLSEAEAAFGRAAATFTRARQGSQVAETALQDSQRHGAQKSLSTGHGASVIQQQLSLSKAASLDTRLSYLENTLGLNGLNMPDETTKPSKPILHMLDTLDLQLSTLTASTSNSINSLDAASLRVRQLTQEAERLEDLRKSARILHEGGQSTGSNNTDGESQRSYIEDLERVSKINALYGTLPTINLLSPTLPMVLERLRTLRFIHTSAGTASAALTKIEQQQEEQAVEVMKWREALAKVESQLLDGEGTLKENLNVVGDWVKDLETRIARF